ncbi:MAG: DinB family protein [Lewinellaceae bacterium]|nr:DinB family protein [Saprospiraceae bacterium]MCB9336699.1 DinB family protein [Lewinellaceae bacterium]
MSLSRQIAGQFKEVQLSGTWVATNLKTQLSDVTWEQATTKVGPLNTIAALAFHINYYVAGLVQVLEGGPLDIRDKYSFDMPPIHSQADWEKLLDKMWADAEKFASLVEQMPDERLWEGFVDEKYGNYYRNLLGMIEHSYYHLGQIVLIKKILMQQDM